MIMILRKQPNSALLSIVFLLLLSMCKPTDLRNQALVQSEPAPEAIRRGKKLLQKAVERQSFGVLEEAGYYQLLAKDHWNRQMGLNIDPWPGENGVKFNFSLAFGSFDSQVTFSEGRFKGNTYGIQTWRTYMSRAGDSLHSIEDDDMS